MLAGCAAAPEPGRIVAARIEGGAAAHLDARLALAFSPRALEGLRRGVPLTLVVTLRVPERALEWQGRWRLRHLPLAQRFVLEDAGGVPRSFERRTQLLAALDRLRARLPEAFADLPPGTALELQVAIDRRELPAPLQLPALFGSDYRLDLHHAWTVAG